MVDMKVVVLGAGLMGKEAARDLVKSDDVEKVYLADLNVRQAEDFAEELDVRQTRYSTVGCDRMMCNCEK